MRTISFQDLFVSPSPVRVGPHAPQQVPSASPRQPQLHHPSQQLQVQTAILFPSAPSHAVFTPIAAVPRARTPPGSGTDRESFSSVGSGDSPTRKGSIDFILGGPVPGCDAHVKAEPRVVGSHSPLAHDLRLASPTMPCALSAKRDSPDARATTSTTSTTAAVGSPGLEGGEPAPKRRKKRKARICKTPGCDKYVVDHGLCIRHGGGKRCNVEGCNCRAQNRGLCWKHGGYTICKVEGCAKRAKSRGICWSHGGGTRCKADGCAKIAVSLGRCWAHGGGKRCSIETCRKPASERTDNLCADHFSWYHQTRVAPEAVRYMLQ